jgi:dienelactone hydrolase
MILMNKQKLISLLIIPLIFLGFVIKNTDNKKQELTRVLGDFPEPPELQIDTLESVKLENGWRYKIEYLVENEDTLFDIPKDIVRAYLFIPYHEKGEKLPGIIAIHQDGNPQNAHLGKLETAGIKGDTTLFYGLELFNRGYIVICPDRFTHGERLNNGKPVTKMEEYIFPVEKRIGELILEGRTGIGKRVYDLMRATDVLYSLKEIDKERIGAIAHSGGGNYLVYFMFIDQRVKLGVSSCGFNDLIDTYNRNYPMNVISSMALPGLAKVGRSADYLAYLAPRPFLMTRGFWEYGRENSQREELSRDHVERTKNIEKYAMKRYIELEAEESLVTVYFEENGGFHSFPDSVKQFAYKWIDGYLKE